jgi:hypothetical protein
MITYYTVHEHSIILSSFPHQQRPEGAGVVEADLTGID